MQEFDKRVIIGVLVAAVTILFVVFVGWFIVAHAPASDTPSEDSTVSEGDAEQNPAAHGTPVTTAPNPAVTPTAPEGAGDYSDVPQTVPPAVEALTTHAAGELAVWQQGETLEQRAARLKTVLPGVSVQASPFSGRMEGVPGSYVTVSDVGSPTLTGDNVDLTATTLRVDVPVGFTMHIPNGSQETTATHAASWRFTVDVSDPNSPKITAVEEPAGL